MSEIFVTRRGDLFQPRTTPRGNLRRNANLNGRNSPVKISVEEEPTPISSKITSFIFSKKGAFIIVFLALSSLIAYYGIIGTYMIHIKINKSNGAEKISKTYLYHSPAWVKQERKG